MSIELYALHKAFGKQVVLDRVDFEVREGETVALLGPSGTGKSVLLKHIIGLIRPDSGTVIVDGKDVSKLKRKDLSELRSDIGSLRRELRSLPSLGQDEPNLGELMRAIAKRLDRIPQEAPSALANVETQIERIARVLDDPENGPAGLARIQASLRTIEKRLDDTRRSLGYHPPREVAGEVSDEEMEAVAGLARSLSDDVTTLKTSTEATERKTKDAAELDEDGYVWYSGRADDVIISAGYRIGPFEVESACVEHPAVKEAAAVASPDPRRGDVVKAFIVLSAGRDPSDELADEIKQHVRERHSAYAYPREVEFVDDLPKTLTGKIRRVELRQQERERKRPATKA